MKLLVVLMLCAIAAAAPNLNQNENVQVVETLTNDLPKEVVSAENRNILVNALVRQLIAYIRSIINNGSSLFGIPPLDPLELDHLKLNIPAGLINIILDLEDVFATGFGGFITHRSDLNLRELTFDVDFGFPHINIRAGGYDLIGDFFTAIPLYGKGEAAFQIDNFRFQAQLFLKQSDDGRSVIIDRIENAAFQLPSFRSQLTGVMGGGDIDAIANALVEEVIADYINRFQGAIAKLAAHVIVIIMNPVLEQLDTWRFLAPLMPRS